MWSRVGGRRGAAGVVVGVGEVIVTFAFVALAGEDLEVMFSWRRGDLASSVGTLCRKIGEEVLASTGNGNSWVFSAFAFGVGLSIAFRALSESAAIRLLSSISPPLGDRDSSSKILLRSLLSVGGEGSKRFKGFGG